jgi:hypothetical protein
VHNFTFSSLSLLNHILYAVSVSEDEGFRITKTRFNIEKE